MLHTLATYWVVLVLPTYTIHLRCKEGYSNDNEKFDKVEVASPLPQPKEVEAGSADVCGHASLPHHIPLELTLDRT